jgi:hypothetical protein
MASFSTTAAIPAGCVRDRHNRHDDRGARGVWITGIAWLRWSTGPLPPVTVSSVEDTDLEGYHAVDGDVNTRWASREYRDPQWIAVDLGNTQHVDKVVLRWEAAFAAHSLLAVSPDGTTWQPVQTIAAGDGDTDSIDLDTSARYVRMFGIKRGTPWGYSLFEFEVYGSATGPAPTSGSADTPPADAPPPVPPAPRQSSNGGAEQTVQAYMTGYSVFDNTPPGSPDISHPILHQTAGGTGTFDDPITVAVGHSFIDGQDVMDWPAGTKFYGPNLRRYLIAEDTCGDGSTPQNGPCHVGFPSPATTWLDIWIDGEGGSSQGADDCMDSITAVWDVLANPQPNYPVVAESVDHGEGCTEQFGNAVGNG